MTVPADFVLPDGVPELHCIDIPAQQYGITIHWGDCDGIADTWSRWLLEWLPQSGYRQRSDGICLSGIRTTHRPPRVSCRSHFCARLSNRSRRPLNNPSAGEVSHRSDGICSGVSVTRDDDDN